MGTREEILALSEQWRGEPWAHIYNQALVDASHVLDRWEWVAEGRLGYEEIERAGSLLAIVCLLGGKDLADILMEEHLGEDDHIAIYRKRPQGDSKEK